MPSVFQNLETSSANAAVLLEQISALVAARDVPASGSQPGIAALVMRGDSDVIGTADGDLSMIRVDEEGRVKVASKTASFPVTTGNLTTAAQTVIVDVRRASNVMLHVKNTGSVTHAAGQYTFEGSLDSTNGTDGTWFAVQAVRTNANTIETATGTLSMVAGAGLAYAWEASVNAVQWFRVRCTTTPTASSIATWTIQRGTYATKPVPAAQASATQPVSGSVTATVTPANPAAALTGDTGAKTATGNGATQTNAASRGAHIVINVGAVTGTTPTLTVKVQGSADSGTTWVDLPGATTAAIIASGAYGVFVSPGSAPVAGVATAGTAAVANITLPRTWRIVWTITGTTPSFTLTNVQVAYIL